VAIWGALATFSLVMGMAKPSHWHGVVNHLSDYGVADCEEIHNVEIK
jgi:hypothetical protein